MDNQIQELMKMISFYLGVTAQLIFLLPEKIFKTLIISISVLAYLVLITSGEPYYILKEQSFVWILLVVVFLVINKKNVLKKINLTTISVFAVIYFYLLFTHSTMLVYFPSPLGLLFLLLVGAYARVNLGKLLLLVFYIYSFTNILIFTNYELLSSSTYSASYLDLFALGMFKALYAVQVLLIAFIVPYILFALEPSTENNSTIRQKAKLLIKHFSEHVMDLSKSVETSLGKLYPLALAPLSSLLLLILNDWLGIISTESFIAILLSGITIFSQGIEKKLL